MAVALLVKFLKRPAKCVLLLAIVSTTALFITFTALPHVAVLEVDLTSLLNPLPTQSMWDATVPLNSTELERKAAIFLRQYKDECQKKTSELNATQTAPLCPCVPVGLLGPFQPNTVVTSWATLAVNHPELTKGGRWKPAHCTARQRVVVVVPYRDRDEHLRILLHNLHPVLQRQQLEYHILVVEQAFPHIFNKASLMNIGFRAALTLVNFDCIVFHDVDMLPADDRQPYTCFHPPTHMGAYLDKYLFGKSYVPMFGGVTSFSRGDYVRVNGFSNLFWGWGGEDDDMRKRIAAAKFTVYRYPIEVSRYRMLRHGHDHRNPVNPFRTIAYRYRPSEYVRDGLSNIKYRMHSYEERPLYTWLLVEPVSSISNYTLRNGTCKGNTLYAVRVPIQKCAELCDANEKCRAFVYDSHVWCLLKRRPCPEVLPSQSQRLYVRKSYKSEQVDALSKYRERAGDCSGGDICGFDGVVNENACAEKCNKLVECVGFVYTTPRKNCYLKLVSCVETSPMKGAKMYDIIDDEMPPMQALESDVAAINATTRQ